MQKNSLMFVVRDWDYDNEDGEEDGCPHGLEGGRKYLERTTKPNDMKAAENVSMNRFFKNAFGEIACFLLPEPGSAVKKTNLYLAG